MRLGSGGRLQGWKDALRALPWSRGAARREFLDTPHATDSSIHPLAHARSYECERVDWRTTRRRRGSLNPLVQLTNASASSA